MYYICCTIVINMIIPAPIFCEKWVAVIANSTIFEYVNIYCIKRGNMKRKPNNKTPRLIIIN